MSEESQNEKTGQRRGSAADEIEPDERLDSIISKMVHSRDTAIIKETYGEWASDYDADLRSYGYVAPKIGSDLLHAQAPVSGSLILDAGCGTGLVGEHLAGLGYTRLHGTDFSDEMLEHARRRGLYESLSVSDFTASISCDDGLYDGVISIGVYKDMFKDILIAEMLRVCKAGGTIVFSARPEYADLATAELMVQQGKHVALTFTSQLQDYMLGQNAGAMYFTVCKGR